MIDVTLTVAKLYAECGLGPEQMQRDLQQYFERGYVVRQPDRLLLFRPAVISRPAEWVAESEADAWLVYLAAGDCGPAWFVDQLPRRLGKIIFMREARRNGRLRVYDIETFRKHC